VRVTHRAFGKVLDLDYGWPMAVNYQVGDATAPEAEGSKIIVHVCNDIGVWGKGFVLALSRRWPLADQRYRAWHRGRENDLPFAFGQVQFVQVAPDTWVANLLGQHDIRARGGIPPIRHETLRKGLRRVAAEANRLAASVHMPRIGCGLAGGKWEEIGPIVEQELGGMPVTVYDLIQGIAQPGSRRR
jgi:O-acetyl-ADP-ribose deacetylase (regulator of RNase III)